MSGLNGMIALVEAIRESQGATYRLLEKMPQGIHGAWMAIDASTDQQVILKLVSSENVVSQIIRSSECSRILREKALPTPRFDRLGYVSGIGSWYIQEFMPGIDAPWPSEPLVDQLIAFNEVQAKSAVDVGNNWSDHILSTLFRDKMGWQETITRSGEEGTRLVEAVRAVYTKFTNFSPESRDLVHGDFQHYNAMIYPDGSNSLSAYVDWQDAGCGDRSIDLARLLYDVYVAELECGYPVSETSVRKLTAKIRENSGLAGLHLFMSYWILQVANFGVRCGPDHSPKFFKTGHRILADMLR